MEKLQTLLWILVGVVVLVVRWWKKAQEATRREAQERRFSRPDPTTGRPRPVAPSLPSTSFEELLKQMQTQNRGAASVPPATPAPDFLDTATPAGRPLPRQTAVPARSLERRDVAARSLEAPAEARSLEVPLHEARRAAAMPRAATQHGQEDYWSRQAARQRATAAAAAPLADLLRNPNNLRAAFVLSEILQRKF